MTRTVVCGLILAFGSLYATEAAKYDYKTLATSKTSTMEKEMNEAAEAGFVFMSVMGGETAFGGKEVLVVMGRPGTPKQLQYRLLAASKTSTLEREMQESARDGFEYKGQTVFESTFGGREVSVIMERDKTLAPKNTVYKLIATSKTSTMQKELAEAGGGGYELIGMTVAKTAYGGSEVVCILRRDQ